MMPGMRPGMQGGMPYYSMPMMQPQGGGMGQGGRGGRGGRGRGPMQVRPSSFSASLTPCQ